MGLPSGVGCSERAQRCSRPMSLFFDSMLEATLFALGGILGGFWEPKWRPKSIFWRFFFDPFFESVFASILACFFVGLWRLQSLKMCTALRREHDFRKIDVFEKCSKKYRFGFVFGGQVGLETTSSGP